MSWFVLEESPLPRSLDVSTDIADICARLTGPEATYWIELAQENASASRWAVTVHERLRLRIVLEALIGAAFRIDDDGLRHALNECDLPSSALANATLTRGLNPKGFWRVDRDKDPELRHTVLTLIAFRDLEARIRDADGNREKGIEAFLNQNQGEGWLLPETLRLADYGLGRDDRARNPQPVASRLGPRFFDWQLTQTPEEAHRESHLHARNLLGEHGYRRLLEETQSGDEAFTPEDADLPRVAEPDFEYNTGKPKQPRLF